MMLSDIRRNNFLFNEAFNFYFLISDVVSGTTRQDCVIHHTGVGELFESLSY